MWVSFTEMQFNGPGKNQEKVVVTAICFYGSAKIEWKIKVHVMKKKGPVAKMIKMRSNNSRLTSKLHGSLLMDFHDTSITGILLLRWSKWGVTILC